MRRATAGSADLAFAPICTSAAKQKAPAATNSRGEGGGRKASRGIRGRRLRADVVLSIRGVFGCPEGIAEFRRFDGISSLDQFDDARSHGVNLFVDRVCLLVGAIGGLMDGRGLGR